MRRLVETRRDISWMPAGSEGRLYVADELPPPELCRTAFGFVFNGPRVLLTRLRDRDWDIPGGHIDPGETPEVAAVREVWEETAARVEIIEPVGFQELEVFGPDRDAIRPPVTVQAFFWCRLTELCPFEATDETSERAWFEPGMARQVPTMQGHRAVYEEGLRRAIPVSGAGHDA
jgi:8-oxo-dGTP pyrophosphatase MutT (NUDIX family)